MSDQYELLSILLKQQSNFYVLGLPGSGKTYNVRNALETLGISFYRINHLYCHSKDSMLMQICKALSALWSIDIKPQKKFSQLALTLSQLTPQGNHRNNSGYIILDMQTLPSIDLNYFHRLFKLTDIPKPEFSFRIIIICNELHQVNDLPTAPKLILQPYNENELKNILYRDLAQLSTKEEQQPFIQTVQQQFTRDIVNTFTLFTWNLNVLLRISRDLYEHYIQPTLMNYTSNSFLQRNDYMEAKRLLLENPFQEINTPLFRSLIESNNQDPVQQEQNKAKKRQAVQTLESEENKIHLALVPSIILLASYYSAKNPEKSDKTLFRDYKRSKQKKRSKPKNAQITANKKTSHYRLISITQVLLSVCDHKELNTELTTFSQTALFFKQLQYLVEHGYLGRFSAKNQDDDLTKVKYEPRITEKQAFDLAQAAGINFYEFLYNPN